MSSKLDHLHEIFRQQIQEFIDSSKEELSFTLRIDGNDGDDISLSVSAEKLENEGDDHLDQAMDIEEFHAVQTRLQEFMKEYQVPFISMIMLFANQLAFSSLKLGVQQSQMSSWAFKRAFNSFVIMHKAKDLEGYEDMVCSIYDTLTKEIE